MDGLFYLVPLYDCRKSFYGKAYIKMGVDVNILYSYGTKVAEFQHIEEGLDKIKIYGLWGKTTQRHIKEFLLQAGVSDVGIDELRIIVEEGGAYL